MKWHIKFILDLNPARFSWQFDKATRKAGFQEKRRPTQLPPKRKTTSYLIFCQTNNAARLNYFPGRTTASFRSSLGKQRLVTPLLLNRANALRENCFPKRSTRVIRATLKSAAWPTTSLRAPNCHGCRDPMAFQAFLFFHDRSKILRSSRTGPFHKRVSCPYRRRSRLFYAGFMLARGPATLVSHGGHYA